LNTILYILICIAGIACGYVLARVSRIGRSESTRQSQEILDDAKKEADVAKREASIQERTSLSRHGRAGTRSKEQEERVPEHGKAVSQKESNLDRRWNCSIERRELSRKEAKWAPRNSPREQDRGVRRILGEQRRDWRRYPG